MSIPEPHECEIKHAIATAELTLLVQVHRHLDDCGLSANTVAAYRRHTTAYVAWLQAHMDGHTDAFADIVGAEAAVAAWREHLLRGKQQFSINTINQALTAVTLLYRHGPQLRIKVKRVPAARTASRPAWPQHQVGRHDPS